MDIGMDMGNNAAVNKGINLRVFASNSLDVNLRVGFLGHVVVLWLTFWGADELFYSGHSILYFYQQCMKVPVFPHPCRKQGERIFLEPPQFLKYNHPDEY